MLKSSTDPGIVAVKNTPRENFDKYELCGILSQQNTRDVTFRSRV